MNLSITELQRDELDEQREKLISLVPFADSHEEVKHLVTGTITFVRQFKMGNEMLISFIDQIIRNLDDFTPMEWQAQQWDNIKVTRIFLWRIKQNVQTQII